MKVKENLNLTEALRTERPVNPSTPLDEGLSLDKLKTSIVEIDADPYMRLVFCDALTHDELSKLFKVFQDHLDHFVIQ